MTDYISSDDIDDADDIRTLFNSIRRQHITDIRTEMSRLMIEFTDDYYGDRYMLEIGFDTGNLWLHDRDEEGVIWRHKGRR